MNVTIIGCGDVGTRCATLLQAAGHQVVGVRRQVAGLPSWLSAVAADVLDPASLGFLRSQNQPADMVIYSLAASGFTEQAYHDAYVGGVNNVLEALRGCPPKCMIFVSSTGVYHQNDGSVIDEHSPTEPTRFNGQMVLRGEQKVRDSGFGCCVRFSGIYGPDRLRMINRVAAGQATLDAAPPYTNRIHIEDCAAVLAHLVEMIHRGEAVKPVYIASDNLPATSVEVESYIATMLGLSLENSEPVARTKRIAGSKRCSNQRLLDTGYVFKYPDYKAGYQQVISSMKAQARGEQS